MHPSFEEHIKDGNDYMPPTFQTMNIFLEPPLTCGGDTQ